MKKVISFLSSNIWNRDKYFCYFYS